jgi:hypothetical protein
MSGQEESPVLARRGMWEIIRPAPVKIPVMSDAETRTAAVNYIRARYAQNVTWHEVEYDWWRGA